MAPQIWSCLFIFILHDSGYKNSFIWPRGNHSTPLSSTQCMNHRIFLDKNTGWSSFAYFIILNICTFHLYWDYSWLSWLQHIENVFSKQALVLVTHHFFFFLIPLAIWSGLLACAVYLFQSSVLSHLLEIFALALCIRSNHAVPEGLPGNFPKYLNFYFGFSLKKLQASWPWVPNFDWPPNSTVP